MVDFNEWDAKKIERMHRAISHQRPLTITLPSSKLLQLHKPAICLPHSALVEPGDATYNPRDKSLVIRCARDTYVRVAAVKQEGRNLLPVSEWWNGVPPAWQQTGLVKFRNHNGVDAEGSHRKRNFHEL